MAPTLLLKLTDGRELTHWLSESAFSLGGLDFSVSKNQTHGLREYRISFVPTDEVRVSEVRVDVRMADTSVGEHDSVLVYDNSYCTNMFAGIREFKNDEDTTRAREIAAVKSADGVFNCAFTTADRFFTDIYVWRHLVSIRFYLEDKPVRVGETYTLESFATDDGGDTLAFFENYAALLAERYVTRPKKNVPFGWSSWSCMYGKVTEDNLIPEIRSVGRLLDGKGGVIQVDDGWQGNESFLGEWKYDPAKFPSGGAYPAKTAEENGLTYGLWIAPGLVHDKAPRFEELDGLIYRENEEKSPTFATVYPLQIDKKEIIDDYRTIFTRMMNEYGSRYFKIDFLINLITRIADTSKLSYEGGYSVEVYKNFLRSIRETVGDETFLNACGASFGESAGIFDGIRTSSDITWEGVGKNPNIKWWEIFQKNIQNIILRSPYDRVFITDPDGLVVRDYITPYGEDECRLSYDEARCYATAVAMSGGHILLNEESLRLGEDRLKLFTHILPPLGKAARPADFFDFPMCTESYVDLGGAAMVALWNLGDERTEKTLDTQRYASGRCALIDAWTHDVTAVSDGCVPFDMPPHTVRAYLVKPLHDGEVLFSASNFWCGYSGIAEDKENEIVYSESGAPEGYEPYENTAGAKLYKRVNSEE